ncbi:MAG: homoserine dehydrogenase, partial [Actinomycetota bacterium]|nr:homoserine dehydrogenase [Actinomycetota bacterium]
MSETGRTVEQTQGQPGGPLRIALLGCGVVGSAVARLLTENAQDLQARVGRPLEIVGV